MVNFMDFYYTGPDKLAGRYMRKVLASGFSRRRIYCRAGPSRSRFSANSLRSIAATAASRMSSIFAARTANRNSPSAGSRATAFVAAFTAGSSIRTGQCVEQPAEKESFAEKMRIRSCPTEEYLGLIFVYFGEGAPPPLPRYPDFEKDNLWAETYMRPVQLRQQFGKRSDSHSVHPSGIGILHESAAGDSGHQRRRERLGRAFSNRLSRAAGSTSRSMACRTFCASESATAIISPGACRSTTTVIAASNSMSPILPKATRAKRTRIATKRANGKLGRSPKEIGEAVLRGDLRIQDIEGPERSNIVWIQDYATQVGQGPLDLRKKETLGRSDRALILIRKIWERELQNLEAGKPLKQWQRTERLAGLHSRAND